MCGSSPPRGGRPSGRGGPACSAGGGCAGASLGARAGRGMLADPAGQAAVAAWAGTVAKRIDAWYIAFDMDALDASGRWAIAMPESEGLSLATAVATVRSIATSGAP